SEVREAERVQAVHEVQAVKQESRAEAQDMSTGKPDKQPAQFEESEVKEAVQVQAVHEVQAVKQESRAESGLAGMQNISTAGEEPKPFKLHLVEPLNKEQPAQPNFKPQVKNKDAENAQTAKKDAKSVRQTGQENRAAGAQVGNASQRTGAGKKMTINLNGSPLIIEQQSSEPLRFMDLLKYTQIDEEEPGISLILKLNGQNASYIDPLRNNDEAEIRWER
ncbi:MAG: hypothetical protein HFE90_09180, partial [Firmicutes bacterium]|nr:hypothetical protein [Bacillota bacterium]